MIILQNLETQNVLNKTAPYKSLFDCNRHMELTDDYFIEFRNKDCFE